MPAAISRPLRRAAAAGLVLAALAATGACSTAGAGGAGGGDPRTVRVVAAENFWGSIAAQLGGSHAQVTSIIDNPATDPHDYEPTAADARAVAGAQLTIVNGIGYDAWAGKLLAATPADNRVEITVGDLVGIAPGGNPHRWYSPSDVHRVIEQITADYKKIDPADAGYFEARRQDYEHNALAGYDALIAKIRQSYAGTPIGASESIISPLAASLGLKVLTPPSFLNAVSEGSDPTAHDKAVVDQQIAQKQIKVYLYNSQNSTPDVQAQVRAAKAAGIPVATVTETLTPAGATFQDWQTRQLQGIERALATATGK